jgi:hypothetical protein
MKWLLLLLGLASIGAAAAGLVASIDLLTTEIGILYASCAVSAFFAGLVFLALAGLAYRIDALRKTILRQNSHDGSRRAPADVDFAPPVEVEPQWAAPPPIIAAPPDEAQAEAEAPAESAAPPTLVGRYSAGGASYNIFSDGSIEAQTSQGDYRFASMSEFKAFLAAQRG